MKLDVSSKSDPALWNLYYEAAIAEPDPSVRLRRIAEAHSLILLRARDLEESEASIAERKALEDAVDFLSGLKLESLSDGVGKEVENGDVESIENAGP